MAALGGAYLFFGTDGSARDTAKELGSEARGVAAAAEGKLGLRHSQQDYQKVYDAIAEEMELENYDGESLSELAGSKVKRSAKARHCWEAEAMFGKV